MKKGILILILLILALFSVSCVCAADVDDAIAISEDTVAIETSQSDEMTASDDSNVLEQSDDEELILEDNDVDKPMLGEGASTGSFTDLDDLINNQYSSNDTITLSCNYTFNGTDDDDSGFIHGISINRRVTIDGKGCTIDGSQKARIFHIGDSGSVKFLNINFINGNATGSGWEVHGGAILAPNRNCVVECCNFTNNTADSQGGALFGVNAYNCTFTGNTAYYGGAILGGSAYNCTFTGNTAESDGGAILGGSAYNCTFTGNTANSGGAINDGSAYNSIFTGNTAIWGDGGAITGGSAYNCVFTGNTAERDGGAMMGFKFLPEFYSATLCMFDSNSPNDYIYIRIVEAVLSADNLTTSYKSGDRLLFNLTADNTNYVGFNTTIKIYQDGQEIGTYYALSGEGWIVDLSPGTYKAVLSLDKYEGVINGTATITVMPNNTFWALNQKINGNDKNEINLNNDYYYNPEFDTAFTEGIVINREVTINGNGFTINALDQSRIFNITASKNVTLNNITFINGHSDLGGAIIFDNAISNSVIENCKFINNTANENGGAIYAEDTFENNIMSNIEMTSNNAIKNGGAIYIAGATNENVFKNMNFTNNTVYMADGGAINFHSQLTHTTFINLTFKYNRAANGGGAINTDNNVNDHNIYNNSYFINNIANKGGSINGYGYSNYNSFDGCIFINNTAINSGGAIYYARNIESNTLKNCRFINNNAKANGGAIYSYRNSNRNKYINTSFINNSADNNGGAIYNRGSSDSEKYRDAVFINNSARDIDGGGINVYSDLINATFENVSFINNTAAGNGGAINVDEVAKCTTFANTHFINNTAGKSGGALSFVDSKRNKLDNAIFIQNRANINGSAIQIFKSMLDDKIIKSSFTDNHAKGAVISAGNVNYCDFQAAFMNNTGEAIIFLNAVNNTLINNSVLLNNAAESAIAVNLSDNLSIHNSIFMNTVSEYEIRCAGGMDANYNWFGNNATDYKSQPNMNDVNYDTWLFLNATANPNTLTVPETSKIIFMLYCYNSTSNETSEYLFHYPVNLTVTATGGNVNDSVKLNETLTYTATAGGTGSVTASIGDASCTVELEIAKANSTLTVENMTFDYNSAGSVNVSFSNATGIVANVVDHPEANVTVNGNTITVSNLAAGIYTLNVTTIVDEDHNPVTGNATITVNKLQTQLTGNAITATYNINKNLVITLKDGKGNALPGVSVTVNLKGSKTYTTDRNGQVKVSTKGLTPKTYTVAITFDGNENYTKATANAKITVKKATPKLTAKKKTFKTSVKTKKYTVTLKDNTGKAIKKAKVTLKVKGKTYKATTNSKGKAVFKIKNLKKKGKYTAVIKFKGNKYYNKATKKAKIKVIVTFKTVSKGSKDKSTVKEIQQALKDHGYYLSYKGHYLKIDGKFKGCTERSVKEFQHDKGLKVTGKVDEKTAKKLGII